MQSSSETPRTERFGYRLGVLARRWRQQIDAELEIYGLSQALWRPLIHLASFGEPPRQCQLADSLQIGSPALVRLLDQLERKGLVERVAVDGDRRANHVQLTSEGRTLADRVCDIIVAIERELLRDVSEAELAICTRAFSAIEDRLDTLSTTTGRRRRRA